MKNSIFGTMMILSVAIIGGGIDIGSKFQTIAGLVMFLFFAGGVIADGVVEDIKNYNKSSYNHNVNDYPCFFRK